MSLNWSVQVQMHSRTFQFRAKSSSCSPWHNVICYSFVMQTNSLANCIIWFCVSVFFIQDIRANFTSPVARFAVSNLHPGSVYIISIYAFNSKGRSDPAVLPAAMLRPAEKQLTAEKGRPINSKYRNKNCVHWWTELKGGF